MSRASVHSGLFRAAQTECNRREEWKSPALVSAILFSTPREYLSAEFFSFITRKRRADKVKQEEAYRSRFIEIAESLNLS